MKLVLNGLPREVEVPADGLLLDLVRGLGLTGAKEGCGAGVCGACTVLVDGDPVSSCTYLAACAEGREVWTPEGIAESEPDLVQALAEHEALQCGICTPGQLVALAALRRAGVPPDEASLRGFLAGNLCRCTGYAPIVAAARAALGG